MNLMNHVKLEEAIAYVKKCLIGRSTQIGGLNLLEQSIELIVRSLETEQQEHRDLQATFDLRHKADMRAIKRWQEAHPGKELTWPDHADLVCWLMEQIEQVRSSEPESYGGFLESPVWKDGTLKRLADKSGDSFPQMNPVDGFKWVYMASMGFWEQQPSDERAAGSESSGTTPVVSKSPQAQGHGESSTSQDSLPPASATAQPASESERVPYEVSCATDAHHQRAFQVRGGSDDWFAMFMTWDDLPEQIAAAEVAAREYAEAMNHSGGSLVGYTYVSLQATVNELRAERDQLREQVSLTREWLNAWEAGLFSADQCWVKLRSKLAERAGDQA